MKSFSLQVAVYLTIAVICTPADLQAQTDSVPLYEDLGNYHLGITTTIPLAQRYFDQGIRLYYAFNHAEAIRAFREAQRLDPECAMCWWGEALAWGPNINLPMDTPSAQAAFTAINAANARRSGESSRELAMLDALTMRYSADAPEDRAHLDQAYAEAMAAVDADYPDDNDVSVLYAEALMNLRPWDYWTEQRSPRPGIDIALDQLEAVLDANASHPGACHFYIHAVEEVFPERAVPCAERLAELMPGAGHLVHMPGHIYIRVGRYLDAVEANQHAVHADETYIQDQRPGMGMYTAGYYPHNYDFMAFAAMMIGRGNLAVESATRVTSLLPAELSGGPGMDFLQHWSVRPLQMQVRFARWQDILGMSAPADENLYALGIWHYARGRALAATGAIDEASNALRELRRIATNPGIEGLRMEFNQASDLLAIADQVLAGWIAFHDGNQDAAITALETAVQLEDALLYGEPPEWSVPTRQDLGAVLSAAGRASEAEVVFRQDLAKFPENGWSLFGLMRALGQQGKWPEANRLEQDLARVWTTADVNLESVFPGLR